MGRNKDSGLDSMTSPLSWMSGLVNKGSCDRGPGWPPGRAGEAGGAACLNAGLQPSFSPGASAFTGISSKGKPGQEVTLPWRPERPFQTQGKTNTFWLHLTPTKPGWSHHLVQEALVFLRNGQWPLLQGLSDSSSPLGLPGAGSPQG